jgi:hypothetical protein
MDINHLVPQIFEANTMEKRLKGILFLVEDIPSCPKGFQVALSSP